MEELTFEESANLLMAALLDPRQALPLKPRKLDKKKGTSCFAGNDAVTCMTEKLGVESRDQAVLIGQKLVKGYFVVHVTNNKLPFKDDDSLYYFLQDPSLPFLPDRISPAIRKLVTSEPGSLLGNSATQVLEPPPRASKANSPWTVILNSLPQIPVQKPVAQKIPYVSYGPGPNSSKHSACCEKICGHAISTYPKLPEIKGIRHYVKEGDPICDRYAVMVSGRACIFAIADGCNWGNRPLESAVKAVDGFLQYMNSHLKDIADVHEAGHRILRAFCEAHNKIVEGKEDPWEAGTTTLLGGVLLPVSDAATIPSHSPVGSPIGSPMSSPPVSPGASPPASPPASPRGADAGTPEKWAFVAASVGDCKALLYSQSKRSVIDITKNNRGVLLDATDPGGRLGPYLDSCGNPDLRNLSLYYYPHAEPDDVLILISDGIHDNLEPQSLGLSPQALLDNEKAPNWKGVPTTILAEVQNSFRTKLAEHVIWGKGTTPYDTFLKAASCEFKTGEVKFVRPRKKATPKRITKRLLAYTEDLTANSRIWMEENSSMRLPDDHQLYPGKMDHATCVTIRVGITEPDMRPYQTAPPTHNKFIVNLYPFLFLKRTNPDAAPQDVKFLMEHSKIFNLEKLLGKETPKPLPAVVSDLFSFLAHSVQQLEPTGDELVEKLLKATGCHNVLRKNQTLEYVVGDHTETVTAHVLVSASKKVLVGLLVADDSDDIEWTVADIALGIATQQQKQGNPQDRVVVVAVSNYSFCYYIVDTPQKVLDGVRNLPNKAAVDIRYFPDKLLKKHGFCIAETSGLCDALLFLCSVKTLLATS